MTYLECLGPGIPGKNRLPITVTTHTSISELGYGCRAAGQSLKISAHLKDGPKLHQQPASRLDYLTIPVILVLI